MKKITFLFAPLAVILLITSAMAQTSVHEANTSTVANTYWTHLGRNPDPSGLAFWTYQMDSGAKDAAGIQYAFAVSSEFQSMTRRPTSCIADYSHRTDFSEVRYGTPKELITTSATYAGRTLVGEGLDPATGILGNVVIIKTKDCSISLWYDFAKNWGESLPLISELPNSREIQITYDPVTGMGYNLKILSYK